MTTSVSGKAKAPISSHPAFPAIVALWFAALLGVGSMVLPVVLLENLIDATGLASLLPAAQPPLGATARIVVALVCAGLGVVTGLSIARKVVAAQNSPQPRKRGAVAGRELAKRPFSARDELGLDDLGSDSHADFPAPAGRRRALAMTDENARSDFLEAAPLPGPDAYAAPVTEADTLDLGHFEEDLEPQAGDTIASEPVHLAAVAPTFAREEPRREPEPRQVFQLAEPDAEAPEVLTGVENEAAAPEAPLAASAFSEPPALQAPPAESPREESASPSEALLPEARENLAGRPLRELAIAELVERFALSLERRSQGEVEEPLELPQLKSARAAPEPAPESAAEPVMPPPSVPAAFNPFESENAPEPAAQQAPPPPSIPAALRPVGFGESDEADDEQQDALLGDLTLSLGQAERPFARPAQATAAPDTLDDLDDEPGTEAEDGEEAGEGYSSLLAMKSPFGSSREFVRIEEDEPEAGDIEPVVVFPGQQQQRRAAPASDGPSRDPLSQPRVPQAGFRPFDGPAPGQQVARAEFANSAMPTRPGDKRADPAQTERALRDALQKLQRMSGAA